MLDVCKTRTKKLRPDMFNFYVVLAGPDKVSDAGRATTFRRKFKAPSLQTKSTKKERLPKMNFTKNRLTISEKNKKHFLA